MKLVLKIALGVVAGFVAIDLAIIGIALALGC